MRVALLGGLVLMLARGAGAAPSDNLIDTKDPGIVRVRAWAKEAKAPVKVLPPGPGDRLATLAALHVSTRSTLGAVAYETGGILVDDGFLRILGFGCPELPRNIALWNGRLPAGARERSPRAVLVADDAVGGFFAVNGGELKVPPGNVIYLAPDSLEWEDTGLGYSDWLRWVFSGALEKFYQDLRWKDWRKDVRRLAPDQGFSFYPFLWTKEGSANTSRRAPVPIEELWELTQDLRRQLGVK